MRSFNARYWNLTQAAAWVVYRDPGLVDEFAQPSRDAWAALKLYPLMHSHKPVGSIEELQRALVEGRVVAHARRDPDQDVYEAIPAIEWTELTLRPPGAYRSHPKGGRLEPYGAFRFESAHLKKLWPNGQQSVDREWYDWEAIRSIWEEIEGAEPAISGRQKTLKVQQLFEKRFGRKPPSRSAIDRHIAKWNLARSKP